MNEVAYIELKSPRARGLRGYFRLKKRLPEPTGLFRKGDPVSDGCWIVGEYYLDPNELLVRVLDTTPVFMGTAALIEYSNGALRWVSYEIDLYTIENLR